MMGVGCSSESNPETGNVSSNISESEVSLFGILSLRTGLDDLSNAIPSIVIREFSADSGAFAQFFQMEESVRTNELESRYRLPVDTCRVEQRDNDAFAVFVAGIRLYSFPSASSNIPTPVSYTHLTLPTKA